MCAQTFMYDLIGAMSAVGIQTPRMDDLPEIVFHESRRSFPGETLKQAVDLAADFFKVPPKIIFVLLPDTGRLPLPCSKPHRHKNPNPVLIWIRGCRMTRIAAQQESAQG